MPYPEEHPLRASLKETHNLITNVLFESKMTGGYWRANVGDSLSFIVGQLDQLTYAVENLMDQVDYDPGRYRPRPVETRGGYASGPSLASPPSANVLRHVTPPHTTPIPRREP